MELVGGAVLGFSYALVKSCGNPKVFLALLAGEAVLGGIYASVQAYGKLPVN